MEPFTVTCSTCQSRIRVRNHSLIGQLVNCPKCNSIILIEAGGTTAEQSPMPAPVDSKAITREGIEASGMESANAFHEDSDEYRLLPPEVTEGGTARGRSTAPPIGLAGTAGNGATEEKDTAGRAFGTFGDNPSPPIHWKPGGRASPSQDWVSRKTNRKRQFLLVAVWGLTSLVITGVLFAMFLRWTASPSRPGTNLAQTDSTAPTDSASSQQTVPADQMNDRTQEEAVDSLPDQQKGDATGNNGEGNGTSPPLDNSSPDKSSLDGQPQIENAIPSVTSPNETSPSEAIPSVPQVSNDRMPITVDENPGKAATEADQTDDSASQTKPVEALPAKLRELAEVIGQPFELYVPQTLVVPERAPVTAEELGLSSASSDKSLPPLDLHAASHQFRIRALKLDDVPLAHSINYLSLASGLPITLDANSLAAANRKHSQKVRMVLGDSSAADGVHKFAQDYDLQLQSVENRYFRLYARQPGDEQLPREVEIGALVKDEAGQQWLRTFLDQFFPSSSDGITIENSKLIANPETVDVQTWFVVARALENWRTQQGLASRLTSYEPENLQVPFVRPKDIQGFDQPLKQITTSAQPLASWMSALCNGIGFQCWIDWPSLAALGIEPGTLIAVVTLNRSLKSVLSELEFEHNLVSVIIDRNTLWLTSQTAYRQSPDLFVLPSQNQNLEYWEQYLRPLTPVMSSGVSKIELLLTPDGKFLFAKCCRPTLRFQ